MRIRQIHLALLGAWAATASLGVHAQVQGPVNALAQAPATAPSQTAERQVVSLPQALDAARNNLDVALARSSLAGAQADVVSANRAPLPVLSTGLSNIDLQNGNGPGSILADRTLDKSIGIDWTWERGNKRALRTISAQQNAAAAGADLQEVLTLQQLAVYGAYFDLLAAQERLGHFQALERLAAQTASNAKARVTAGDLAVQDGLRTDIEAQRARSDLQQAELDRQRAALALWQSSGLNVNPQQLAAQADWPQAITANTPDWARVVEARADVRAASARVLAAQAALDNAKALKTNDITWGATYDHYPGTSNALLALRMQMPLQWGYSFEGEIARATAQLAQAQDALEKTRRIATSELQRLQQETLNTSERLQVYANNILPQAQRVADGAELAYSKGALSLTDLLDARRTLRATLIEALSARTDFAKASGAWQLRLTSQEPK
jgi:cobalt-zinc-cadmium efflux system outer membrane protein